MSLIFLVCLALTNDISLHFNRKDSKAVLLPTNDSSTRSGEETEIMNPPQTTETAIEKLNIYIIPSILGNLKSENISLVGDQIRWTIKFIFETLIDDPNSVAVYAKMCCKLGKQIGIFNSCLMEFCQKEFECHLSQVSVYQCYDVHLQTILNTERDPIKQKEYFSMLEKSIEKQSHRSMTIVHFICELYRLCLIPEQVIEYCLITLLSPEIISEVSLKCVCCILMKFDKSLRVPVNLFDRLNQVFHVFSYELLSRYTVKIRWMIDDTVKLINFTKQMNTQQINNIPMNLKPVQQGVVLNQDQHHIPNTISKEKEDLLKKLRDLRIT